MALRNKNNRINKTNPQKEDFYQKVFKIVAEIPHGKVTTYGDIAQAIRLKSSARMDHKSRKGRNQMVPAFNLRLIACITRDSSL